MFRGRRWARVGFCLLAVAMVLGSSVQCRPAPTATPAVAPTPEAKVLKIGAAVEITGAQARMGKLVIDGYKFWRDYVNEHGGIDIGGETYIVDIIFYDDESDPERAAKLTEKLITEDGVTLLLGPFSSAITIATSAIGEKYNAITIASMANSPSIYTRGYKNVFSVLPPAPRYLRFLMDALVELEPKPKTIAILARDDPFAVSVGEGTAEHAKEVGLEVVYNEKFPKELKDASTFLTSIKALDPDLVFCATLLEDAILIAKQAKDLKVCPKALAFSVGATTPDFRESLGDDAEYLFGSEWWLPNMGWKGPVMGSSQDYARVFEEKFGYEPDYHVAGATAAGVILQLALEKAGSTDVDAVRKALNEFDMELFWGPTAWDETGQNIKGGSGPIQIQEGRVVAIYPPELRQAEPIYPMPCWDER